MSDEGTQSREMRVRCRDCGIEWDMAFDGPVCDHPGHAQSLNGSAWYDGDGNEVAPADPVGPRYREGGEVVVDWREVNRKAAAVPVPQEDAT